MKLFSHEFIGSDVIFPNDYVTTATLKAAISLSIRQHRFFLNDIKRKSQPDMIPLENKIASFGDEREESGWDRRGDGAGTSSG
jgi:hypothetical protein